MVEGYNGLVRSQVHGELLSESFFRNTRVILASGASRQGSH